jgi:hypothetical protein
VRANTVKKRRAGLVASNRESSETAETDQLFARIKEKKQQARSRFRQ